jgi:hypothetical protein
MWIPGKISKYKGEKFRGQRKDEMGATARISDNRRCKKNYYLKVAMKC